MFLNIWFWCKNKSVFFWGGGGGLTIYELYDKHTVPLRTFPREQSGIFEKEYVAANASAYVKTLFV